MIQVNCHLSSSRFQPCLHAAFKRPAQNIKSRRERDAIFVCLFLKFLSLTGKLEPSLRAPNKTVSSLLKSGVVSPPKWRPRWRRKSKMVSLVQRTFSSRVLLPRRLPRKKSRPSSQTTHTRSMVSRSRSYPEKRPRRRTQLPFFSLV